MYEKSVRLPYSGVYSLHASVTVAQQARFIDSVPWAANDIHSATLDFPLLVENDWSAVGVRLSQRPYELYATILSQTELSTTEPIALQLTKMFNLSADSSVYDGVLKSDPIAAALDARNPGLRPVLFPSLYEAAARTIIGHRLFANQAAAAVQRVSLECGQAAHLPSGVKHAFPAPKDLAVVPEIAGMSAQKISQLRRLGSFAADGGLASSVLSRLTRAEKLKYLQGLDGIGPFSAELLLLRGIGDNDAFPLLEPKLHNAMKHLYGLSSSEDLDRLQEIAQRWSPYRSWIGLLFRNSPEKVLQEIPAMRTGCPTAQRNACKQHLEKLSTPELLYVALVGGCVNRHRDKCH